LKRLINIPEFDRHREKMEKKGPRVLSNLELLAVLLGSGIKGKDVFKLSKDILKIAQEDFAFIKDCYPDGDLKDDLNERERLPAMFRAHSYREFINDLKKAQTGIDIQDNQEGQYS